MKPKTVRGTPVVAWVAALMCGLVACGGSTNQPPAAAVVLDVTIAKGQVTPTNATLGAKVGQPITLRVTSDATDEMHVHSSPDHKFQVAAAPNQTFQFNVDVPGNVEVELHHLDRTIATIQVQP
jgi:heme/copper-type cytochrome/quinol oxidase subunit 2